MRDWPRRQIDPTENQTAAGPGWPDLTLSEPAARLHRPGTAAASCAATYGWEDDEPQSAVLHELGRLTELGVRRHGPIPQEEIARIDAALATGDRTALWNALEEQLLLGMSGEMDAADTENPGLIGAFMLELGLGVDEGEVEWAGVFLAIKAMQRVANRAFAAR